MRSIGELSIVTARPLSPQEGARSRSPQLLIFYGLDDYSATDYSFFFYLTCKCYGFESHPRQLIFIRKSDYPGCAVLLCVVVRSTLLASFFLPFHRSLIHTCIYVHISLYASAIEIAFCILYLLIQK